MSTVPTGSQFGKYQLIRRIAAGGMAEVYLAKAAGPMGFAKLTVVKRILPHLSDDQVFIQMFLSEANLVAQLNHPNVVQIFDFGEVDGTYYLAMELIDGASLRGLIALLAKRNEVLSFALCAKLVSLACEGLGYAHDFVHAETGEPLNLVHRDISPDNILVGRNGSVKVVDFGIAKAAGQSHRTQTGQIKGKIRYMPPEQLRGKELDRRTDIFALGVVLYELITGAAPVNAQSDVSAMHAMLTGELVPVRERRPDTPDALVRALGRAMALDRAQRYASCAEFQDDLERFLLESGSAVGSADIRGLIEHLGIPSVVPARTASQPDHPALDDGALAATMASRGSKPAIDPEASSATAAMRPSGVTGEPAKEPRRVGGWKLGVAAAGLLVAGALGYFFFAGGLPRPQPVQQDRVTAAVLPDPPTPVAEVAPAEPLPEEPAPVAALAPAGDPAVEPAVDGGVKTADQPAVAPTAKATSGVRKVRQRQVKRPSEVAAVEKAVPAVVATGKLEFRVRPFAVVYVDDKKLGQTPIPPIELPSGKHRIRLVNEKLGKDVVLEVQVRAGESQIFKHNLAD